MARGPHSAPFDPASRHFRPQSRRQENVVDLVACSSGAVGAGPTAIVERRMGAHILEVRTGAEQWCQRRAVQRIIEIAGDREAVDALRAQPIVDCAYSGGLRFPLRVGLGGRAVAFALEVIGKDHEA